jgi:S-formylglutathione hydrolase FrmB
MLRRVDVSEARFESEGLVFLTVKSAALAGRADLTLFVPPAVSRVAEAPLVILLHGVYGSHWGWAFKGGAHRTAARLIDSGALPPVVLAMPSDGLWGDGSGYLAHGTSAASPKSKPGPDFERWITEDVPAAVASQVAEVTVGSPLFIAGLSMGGFGALRLAGKFPELFRAVSAHSSITHFDQMAQFVEEPLASFGARDDDWSVLETLLRHRFRLPPLRFDCGLEDPLLDANRELHQALTAADIPHTYEEFPGATNGRTGSGISRRR